MYQRRVSCSSGWPHTHCIAEDDLELLILLYLLTAGIADLCKHAQLMLTMSIQPRALRTLGERSTN